MEASNDWSIWIVLLILVIAMIIFMQERELAEAFESPAPFKPEPVPPYCWGSFFWGWGDRPFYEYGPQSVLPHPYEDCCHDYANKICMNSGNAMCYPMTYQRCAAQS